MKSLYIGPGNRAGTRCFHGCSRRPEVCLPMEVWGCSCSKHTGWRNGVLWIPNRGMKQIMWETLENSTNTKSPLAKPPLLHDGV